MKSLSADVVESLLASDTGSSPTIQEIVERASLAGVALAKHDLDAAALAHRLKPALVVCCVKGLIFTYL